MVLQSTYLQDQDQGEANDALATGAKCKVGINKASGLNKNNILI